ncbi:MAG: hypothetical protein JRD43_02925 [Deltaproteobacteria bacterium]|nr:hypothetical protein [Deltaproteobacteria bacterium]MBW2650241.1 hypothetical protein [Deltaproteobacteria bacterium]
MNAKINKKGNVEDMMNEGALWEDPMCYPTYNATSLLERHGTVRKERNKDAVETSACRVAA